VIIVVEATYRKTLQFHVGVPDGASTEEQSKAARKAAVMAAESMDGIVTLEPSLSFWVKNDD
jgi:hypothetical protein